MVDTVEAFKRQFDPVDDGYLYYPSPNSGGKLISHEEYEGLLRDWTNASKRKRFWLMLGAIMGVIFVFVAVERTLALPEWGSGVFLATVVLAVVGWLF